MNRKSVFCALMLLIFPATVMRARPVQESDDDISALEAQEARQIAQKVSEEIQRTRDLRPLYRAALKDDKDRQQELVNGIAALQVSTKVRDEAGFDDLERFFYSTANLDYLAQLYAFSHYPAHNIDLEKMQIAQGFPPDVRAIILENATLSNWWSAKKKEDRKKIASIQELESVSDTQDRASAMMRDYFSKNPPEQGQLYRQNVALIQDQLMKASAITQYTGSRNQEGTRYIKISVPVLVLLLTSKDGHLHLSMMAPSIQPF